jgi:dimethylaniline monooxygenase (N-oxide forming)
VFSIFIDYIAKPMSVLIIGAGPSGLVALKELTEAGIDAKVVEKGNQIGGAFRDEVSYDHMYLTITNHFMAFSDFPPEGPLKYESRENYLNYLEN